MVAWPPSIKEYKEAKMCNFELIVYAPGGRRAGRLFVEDKKVKCSSDSYTPFKEAVEYLLDNEEYVVFKDGASIVHGDLNVSPEEQLKLLEKYYRYKLGYETMLIPVISTATISKISANARHAKIVRNSCNSLSQFSNGSSWRSQLEIDHDPVDRASLHSVAA